MANQRRRPVITKSVDEICSSNNILLGDIASEVQKANTAQRLVWCILVDTSYSVKNYAEQIKTGVLQMIREIQGNMETRLNVEICVITYNDMVRVIIPCQEAYMLENPEVDFVCESLTYTGSALRYATNVMNARIEQLRQSSTPLKSSFLCLITDGQICTRTEDTAHENAVYSETVDFINASKRRGELDVLCLRVGNDAIQDASIAQFAGTNTVDLNGTVDYEAYFRRLTQVIIATSRNNGVLDLSPIGIGIR